MHCKYFKGRLSSRGSLGKWPSGLQLKDSYFASICIFSPCTSLMWISVVSNVPLNIPLKARRTWHFTVDFSHAPGVRRQGKFVKHYKSAIFQSLRTITFYINRTIKIINSAILVIIYEYKWMLHSN